jgi:hypothetical protein
LTGGVGTSAGCRQYSLYYTSLLFSLLIKAFFRN